MTFVRNIDLEKGAAALLTLALFLLTLWRFGANQCFAVVAVMVVLHRPWRQVLFSREWLKSPLVIITLIFILWALFSLTYTEAPNLSKGLEGVGTYGKLLYLLVFPLVLCQGKYQRWLENGLIYGVLINVLLSTLYYYHMPGISPLLQPHMSMNITFTVNPLQVIYVVMMAIWILALRLLRQQFRWTDIVSFILLTLYLWLINMERSGYLLFLVLTLFLLGQSFGKKAFLTGCVLLPLVFLGLYEAIPNLKARIDLGVDNVIAFQKVSNVQEIGINNSLGARLSFLSETYEVVKKHPLLGTGIGSFKCVHEDIFSEQAKDMQLNDPHNAYAYIVFELGLIGLLIYCAWLYMVWKLTRSLPPRDRVLLRGVWLMFVLMGFTDSGFALNAVGMSFIAWISLYSGRHYPC